MTKKQKKILVRIVSAFVLLIVALFVPLEGIAKFVMFAVIYLIIGYDVLFSAIKNIFRGSILDEKFLMTIATFGAFGIRQYPEAVAVMLFYQIGNLFEKIAVGKSRESISTLMDIRPDYANVLRDGKEQQVSPEEVEVGEIIVVKPGEKIPLDGVVTKGTTTVNTAALTGESAPVDKNIQDNVVSGSVNLNGVINIKTTSEFSESTVAKILDLVENSSNKKAKMENFIARFAKYYTPIVVGCAVLLAVVPPLFSLGEWSDWITRALIFLVASCPCAVVISVPLSFFGGIGGASKLGILIKGANYVEALANVKTAVFDKTGTLTKGTFSVTAIHTDKMSKEELLEIAAFAEKYSNHPIAESIINSYEKQIDDSKIKDVSELSGLGIEAVIDGKKIYAGNSKLMQKIGADYKQCHKLGTIIHVAEENEYLGHIVISDEIKKESKFAISQLKKNGITKTVMLTGDMNNVAQAVGNDLGIDEVKAELLPQQKVEAVEELLKENNKLAFVGDGINDAPVLTRADVGIAMGALGSDAAIEAADVVLMDDDPSKISVAINIARRTMKIVKQNVWFVLTVKAVVLLLGAFGFANIWLAIFADVGVSVIAILNSMRALSYKE